MKITKRQLRSIIKEAMPAGGVPDVVGAVTGVYGEEQRQLLNDLGDMYSDMHKELHGRRPNIPMFKNVEEAQAAVDEIWQEYAESNRRDEELAQNNQARAEMEKRIQDLMPDDYDVELPMHSGMGRRNESLGRKMKITKGQLRRLIREAVWPGYAQKGSNEYSDVIIMSPNGDSLLVNGTETYVEDVPSELSIASGFPMNDADSDNLISALQDQMRSGYVELSVEYANGKWSW